MSRTINECKFRAGDRVRFIPCFGADADETPYEVLRREQGTIVCKIVGYPHENRRFEGFINEIEFKTYELALEHPRKAVTA
jgi:hypothetical protein